MAPSRSVAFLVRRSTYPISSTRVVCQSAVSASSVGPDGFPSSCRVVTSVCAAILASMSGSRFSMASMPGPGAAIASKSRSVFATSSAWRATSGTGIASAAGAVGLAGAGVAFDGPMAGGGSGAARDARPAASVTSRTRTRSARAPDASRCGRPATRRRAGITSTRFSGSCGSRGPAAALRRPLNCTAATSSDRLRHSYRITAA